MPVQSATYEPVIIFDGVCNLCNGFVNFIIRRDKDAKLKFLPLQSDNADDWLRNKHVDRELIRDASTVIFFNQGEVAVKSDAVLKIATFLPFPWRMVRVFRVLPKSIRDKLYDFVAANRYKWFGKKQQCMIPSPEIRERFV